MRLAIDLLWVKHKKVGGIEAYIRNLLDAFMKSEYDFEFVLLLSKDNSFSFEGYFNDSRFKKIICNINSEPVTKRIIWQNLNIIKLLKKENIHLCFEPVYSKPLFSGKDIKFITTIHDLQHLHYPNYHSKIKVLWMKYSWTNVVKTSDTIIAISEFVKEDIIKNFKVKNDKIKVIYNPIKINNNEFSDAEEIFRKFTIQAYEYFYTVSSLMSHKNLITIIKVMKEIKDKNINLPKKLLISGIGGGSKVEIDALINEYKLQDNVYLTGFIDNKERNTLYKHCKMFLFPSIFEGFGMPPLEAMLLDVKVITTMRTSLYEVTQGKAYYVEDPFDVQEWIDVMLRERDTIFKNNLDMTKYKPEHVMDKYFECFKNLCN